MSVRLERAMPLVVAVVALLIAALMLRAPVSDYDGGIASSSATFTLHGLLPYRDYWLLYGPLSGWLFAAPTALFGPSVELARVVGLALVFAQAAIGFLIARQWTAPFAAAVLAVIGATIAAFGSGLEVSAWALAMTFGLAAIAVAAADRSRPVVAGLLLGAAFLARFDLGVYAAIATLAFPDRRRRLAVFAVVAIVTAATLALTTPWSALFEQIVWYPIVGPRVFRATTLTADLGPGMATPAWVVLVLIPRACIVAGFARYLLLRPRDASLLAVCVLAALCQLQTMGRGDVSHDAQAFLPAFLILGAFATVDWAGRVRLAVPVGLTVAVMTAIALPVLIAGGGARATDLRAAAEYVRASTAPDDPVFAGLTRNRYTFINPLIVYYLADRRPGTRTTMYNPGVTNTDARQREMVQELNESGTRVLVLDDLFADVRESENESARPGSMILDRYIAAEFSEVCRFGDYHVLARTSSGRPLPPCPSGVTHAG